MSILRASAASRYLPARRPSSALESTRAYSLRSTRARAYSTGRCSNFVAPADDDGWRRA
jgi:hypothetical protein